jgi:TonB family protein|tara:strand:+ start:4722 stop:5138 length:417 start_codon:yes stop_codon:yes gene_type:complete
MKLIISLLFIISSFNINIDNNKLPTFKGEGDLISFIQDNFFYPKEAKENAIEGKVFIQFVVNKSGKTTKIKLLKGPDILADEAIRVINMITWNPGEVDGKIADVEMVLPFTFKIPSEKLGILEDNQWGMIGQNLKNLK